MTKSKFPLGTYGQPSIDEVNDAFKKMMESSGDLINKMLSLHGDDVSFPLDDLMSPDTYGAERLFIEFFVNNDMGDDFPLIARDFYIHEFSNLSENEDVEYVDIDHGDYWPEIMFNHFTLTLMLNAVNSGSEYTRELFKYLYKTYYKKEYKALKRFSSISSDELLSLARPEDNNSSYAANLARILCISKMYGIEISPDCNHIYAFLNEHSDRIYSGDKYSFMEATGEIYQECLKEIEEKYDTKKLYSLDGKAAKFLGNVLKWLGYNPEFVNWCDENDMGVAGRLASTLAILKRTFPGREFTADELVIYGMIWHCASALTCNMDWMADTLKTLAYGEEGTYYYEDYPSKFHPEEVRVNDPGTVKKVVIDKTKKAAASETGYRVNEDNEALIAEIESLRRRVHKLEIDNNNLRVDLAEFRRSEADAKSSRDKLDSVNRELVALRDYVYKLTEEDSPAQPISVDIMKETLSRYHIVIIGGHSNWVSKMKKEFPDWVYVNPEASGSTDVSIVDKADHVYFFTDTISHSKYYQFMNVVRERKVDFGYIHGVNIEKNIRSIYRDFEE